MSIAPRVIIAHPDPQAAAGLESAFRREGWLPVTAGDALQTLARIAAERPAFVLLHSQLPGGGGLFTLRQMKNSLETATIPVIALLGRFGGGSDELSAAGARECLPESADLKTICAAVRRQLGQPLPAPEAPAEILRAPERIAALHATGLMDSPAEASFDLLTGLASRLLGVPGQPRVAGGWGAPVLQEPGRSARAVGRRPADAALPLLLPVGRVGPGKPGRG